MLLISGKIIGKSIKLVYPNLQISSARCSKNWAKSTQRYYGINLSSEMPKHKQTSIFTDIVSQLPNCLMNDFLVLDMKLRKL